ncbi:MAG: DUF3597 domain-containing protein [Lachnospiraceae bacterium]|nr:DUF3597 domain-containing protein [Lachnospiraceae bacterium]
MPLHFLKEVLLPCLFQFLPQTEVNTCLTIVKENNLTQYDRAVSGGGASEGSGERYYSAAGYQGNSIVEALSSIGVDSSYGYRKRIAQANGIAGYSGMAQQNGRMLELLKGGRLVKAQGG